MPSHFAQPPPAAFASCYIHSDVISGVAADYVGMDVHVKFGDSRSNGSRDIRGADFESNERTYRSLSHKAFLPKINVWSAHSSTFY